MEPVLKDKDIPQPRNRLEQIAELLAIVGCVVLLALSVLTALNVAALALLQESILGVSEVSELAMGIAIFFFFPYTQIRSAHIVVDLLDFIFPRRMRNALDIAHNLIFTVVIFIIAERLVVGGYDAWSHGERSMMIELPLWIGYAAASFSSFLFAIVCLYSAVQKIRETVH